MNKEEQIVEKKVIDESKKNPGIVALWIGILVALVGIVLFVVFNILDFETNPGLGILVAGGLIVFFGFILIRLRKKGIDYFVTGAITAYIGFFLLALPALIAAFQVEIGRPNLLYMAMGGGLVLILLGYFMEIYDLNIKFIQLMKRLKESLKNFLERINWKLVLSPWNLLILAGLVIMVLARTEILPINNIAKSSYYWIGGTLIFFNFVYHFRKELYELLKNIGEIILTFLRFWWRGIKKFPQILARFFKWLYIESIELFKTIWRALKFIFIRNYFLLFAFGLALYFIPEERIALIREVRIALASLICLVSVIKPLLDWRDELGKRVNSARLYLYKTSHKTRRVFSRKVKRCPYCSYPTPSAEISECWNCKKDIPKCLICSSTVERESDVTICPHCDNIFHFKHLRTWLRLQSTCPVCHIKIEKTEKEKFEPTEAVAS